MSRIAHPQLPPSASVIYYIFLPPHPSTIRIDCITVSTLPVKSSIDDQIQQLFDALLNSLRHSIAQNLQVSTHTHSHPLFLAPTIISPPQSIDAFLSEARESLSVRPQTVEEIAQVNTRHAELARKKPQVHACTQCTCHVVYMYM